MKSLITRAISGALILVVMLGVTFLGNPWLYITINLLTLIALREFILVMAKMGYHVPEWIVYGMSILSLWMMGFEKITGVTLVFSIFVICGLIAVTFRPKWHLLDLSVALFTMTYITLSLGFILALEKSVYVWFIFICSWGTDTFAYIFGMLIGRHPLSPGISPKKTIEGAIGGLLGSCTLSFIFAKAVGLSNLPAVLLMTLIGSILAQIGDLCASGIKRRAGVKDYGTIILGHGGVLDRFDSVLFVSPYIYLIVNFFIY